MHRAQEQVRDFCRDVVGAPTSPAPAQLRDADLRARLILEEALETVDGLCGFARANELVEECVMRHRTKRAACKLWRHEPDLVEAVDGLCDLIYVVYGTAEAIGIDLEPFFDEVHRSNMRKTAGDKGDGVPGKRGHKPSGWEPPQIADLLAQHDRTLAAAPCRGSR